MEETTINFYSDIKSYSRGEKLNNIINSKLPSLMLYTKETMSLIKKYKDILNLNELKLNEYYEVNFIYIYISLYRIKTIDEQITFLKNNIDYIDNWAIVDATYDLLKEKSIRVSNIFFNFNEEFLIRYAYVSLLKEAKNKELTISILKLIEKETRDKLYYVKMGAGWLLSYLFIYNFDETYNYLKENYTSFNVPIIKVGIQKSIDSYRVSSENKELLKEFRKIINAVK